MTGIPTTRPTTRLRALLAGGKIVVAPGAFDPMSARLVQNAGFEALCVTGSGSALGMHGLPDLELVSLGEVAATLRVIVDAVSIPVLGDADTGYGNPLNVRRTTQLFERAGVAGMHMEDTVSPKNGHPTKRLVSKDEMVQKLHAAIDARIDPDFVIVARSDALNVESFDQTMTRCRAYAEAGADMIFVEGLRTREVVQAVALELSGVALLYNPGTTGHLADVSAQEAEAFGYRMMCLPNFATLAAIKGIREVLAVIRKTGTPADAYPLCATIPEMHQVAGTPDLKALQARYFTQVAGPTTTIEGE